MQNAVTVDQLIFVGFRGSMTRFGAPVVETKNWATSTKNGLGNGIFRGDDCACGPE